MQYVNCGCGARYYKGDDWINIDFNSNNKDVISHNILKGLPFSNNSVDAIFSSHMLEHFSKNDGLNHLRECFRILRGGVYSNCNSRFRRCMQRIFDYSG